MCYCRFEWCVSVRGRAGFGCPGSLEKLPRIFFSGRTPLSLFISYRHGASSYRAYIIYYTTRQEFLETLAGQNFTITTCREDHPRPARQPPQSQPPEKRTAKMSKGRGAVDQLVKLVVGAGAASPSPPIGPALGSRGVKSMDFCKVRTVTTVTAGSIWLLVAGIPLLLPPSRRTRR